MDALAVYGSDADEGGDGGDGGGGGGDGEKSEPPVRPTDELIRQLEEALEATETFLKDEVNFDLQELINADGLYKLAGMEKRNGEV